MEGLTKPTVSGRHKNVNGERLCDVLGVRRRNNDCASRIFVADVVLYYHAGPCFFNFRPDCGIEVYVDYIATHDVCR